MCMNTTQPSRCSSVTCDPTGIHSYLGAFRSTACLSATDCSGLEQTTVECPRDRKYQLYIDPVRFVEYFSTFMSHYSTVAWHCPDWAQRVLCCARARFLGEMDPGTPGTWEGYKAGQEKGTLLWGKKINKSTFVLTEHSKSQEELFPNTFISIKAHAHKELILGYVWMLKVSAKKYIYELTVSLSYILSVCNSSKMNH